MRVPLLLLPIALVCGVSLPPPDELLVDGVSLFSQGDWGRAREQLWGSLRSLREVQGVQLRCGEKCNPRGSHLEELVLERADCLLSCEKLQLGQPSLYRLTEEMEKTFHRGAPYNYLQLVHYKLEELDEAAAAAFTFYMRNPHHEQIQDDLHRYRRMRGVQEQSFRDLEEPHYQVLFSQASVLLSDGRLASALGKLEESLTASLSAVQMCRTLCEGKREQEDSAPRGISEVIADYYTQVLQCKQRCVMKIGLVASQKHRRQNFIFSHLHLLQAGYAQLGEWASAADIARTLLLFQPHNRTVLEELQNYESKLQGKTSGTPRENVASYVRQTLAEKKLLYYAMENLDLPFQDPDIWTPEEIIPESLREKVRAERAAAEDAGGDIPYEEVSVTLTPRQLNGTDRVILDGVLSSEECETLMTLVQEAEAGSGDGFRRRRSPHTPHERIQVMSVLRALQMASDGEVETNRAQLLYYAGERARVLTHSYFQTKPLFFSYSQLVCRSAGQGEQEGRSDASHPPHADNCILDTEERACWREPPAYIHRDYSGMLYLNEDFVGGNLFFTELDGTTVTAEVSPRCGRLVIHSSGAENIHGVRAVMQGRRCALALWFTESAEHADQERFQARILVRGGVSDEEKTEKAETLQRRREIRSQGGRDAEDAEKPLVRQQRRRAARNVRDEL